MKKTENKQIDFSLAEAELDKPLTNRGFLAGCALIAEAISSPIALSNDEDGNGLSEMLYKGTGLFVIDKSSWDDREAAK